MPERSRRRLLAAAALVLVTAVAVGWWLSRRPATPTGFAVGNGRLEAEEVQVATKLAGRVIEIAVDEGDPVEAGQVLARMDAATLEAQLAQAKAQVTEAETRRTAAEAVVDQRMSECTLADKELGRIEALRERDVASERDVDIGRTRADTAHSACAAANAQVHDAEASIEAARAQVTRIEAELRDCTLVAPVAGRVQHRLAEPGEVLPAGGRVLTLLDLGDVYMTLFLPAHEAGRVRIGAEARIVTDALPERPIPARVAFVADEAQFTPKHVETRSEREKLSFRVKVQASDGRAAGLKPGEPGVAWIRLDDAAAWPESLH